MLLRDCRLPGSDTPAYLETLPASYGFDPLGLGEYRGGGCAAAGEAYLLCC